MGQMLEEVKGGLGSDATFTWVPEDFLNEQEVLRQLDSLGSTLVRNPDYAGYNQYNVDKAVAAGLAFRPIGVTSRDTVDWYKATPEEERPRGRSLTPEREAEVLAAWHAYQANG